MKTLPKDIDTSSGQWFVTRVKGWAKKKADKFITEKFPDGGDIELFEIPSNDESRAAYVVKADIWRYLDPMRPYLKVINRDIWRKVREIPGFDDFGSAEYTIVPHLLDFDALSGLVGAEEKAEAPVFAVGDKVKILGGAFTGLIGTVVTPGDANTPYRVAVSVFGMNKEVDLTFKEVEAAE